MSKLPKYFYGWRLTFQGPINRGACIMSRWGSISGRKKSESPRQWGTATTTHTPHWSISHFINPWDIFISCIHTIRYSQVTVSYTFWSDSFAKPFSLLKPAFFFLFLRRPFHLEQNAALCSQSFHVGFILLLGARRELPLFPVMTFPNRPQTHTTLRDMLWNWI